MIHPPCLYQLIRADKRRHISRDRRYLGHPKRTDELGSCRGCPWIMPEIPWGYVPDTCVVRLQSGNFGKVLKCCLCRNSKTCTRSLRGTHCDPRKYILVVLHISTTTFLASSRGTERDFDVYLCGVIWKSQKRDIRNMRDIEALCCDSPLLETAWHIFLDLLACESAGVGLIGRPSTADSRYTITQTQPSYTKGVPDKCYTDV